MAMAAAASAHLQSPSVVVAEKETEIILPPPSASNPIPSLPAALRVDNEEQVLNLLLHHPQHTTGGYFRQLLVFSSDSLRTLILRQVLSNPHTRKQFPNKKQNWDSVEEYPWPKALLPPHHRIVGTRVLPPGTQQDDPSDSDDLRDSSLRVRTTAEGAAEVSWSEESSRLQGRPTPRDGNNTTETVDVVTYFLRPSDLEQTRWVHQRIRATKSNQTKPHIVHHRLVYLPQPSWMIQKLLDNLGVLAAPNVSIHNLPLYLFPLETDVISMEYPNAMVDHVVEGTPSPLITTAARSLLQLQDVVGPIPRLQALGPLAEEVLRKFLQMTVDEYHASSIGGSGPKSSTTVSGGDVTALMIIDRKVDWVTPMLSPLTYEGLLDEVVGIDCGFLHVPVSTIQPDEEEQDKRKDKQQQQVALGIHGSDSLFAEVRDQHVEQFGSFLQNQARALRESHANFTNQGKSKGLDEIHQFVKQIPIFTQNLRSLTNHIHLAELVKETTESPAFREQWQTERSMVEGEVCYDLLDNWIAAQYPPFRLLRLLCLQSLCGGGIKSSRYDSFRRDVVQTYGYDFLLVLHNLEKAGLIRRRDTIWMDTTSPFNSLRRNLMLVNAEVDTVEPEDVAYVSSGYAPITTRLVQTAIRGWLGKEDVWKDLPGGRVLDITQQDPPEDLAAALRRPAGQSLGALANQQTGRNTNRKPTLVVFYVGGVTYMEIATMRFLSKRPNFPYHIICLTTKVVNGSTLLRSLT